MASLNEKLANFPQDTKVIHSFRHSLALLGDAVYRKAESKETNGPQGLSVRPISVLGRSSVELQFPFSRACCRPWVLERSGNRDSKVMVGDGLDSKSFCTRSANSGRFDLRIAGVRCTTRREELPEVLVGSRGNWCRWWFLFGDFSCGWNNDKHFKNPQKNILLWF